MSAYPHKDEVARRCRLLDEVQDEVELGHEKRCNVTVGQRRCRREWLGVAEFRLPVWDLNGATDSEAVGSGAVSSLSFAAPPLATVLPLHKVWAWVMIVGNAMAGVWALAAHRVESLRTRALWWFTAAVEVAVFVQVIFGVILYSNEKITPSQFHMFYGFVSIVAVGFLYAYRYQLRHKLFLLYGFGGLFIMGLGLRSVFVGTT